ncbi:MAG: hypothetical protein KGK12_13750, partial [Armatimonadetes bacterium]|nr:hypothetical protein [Armatimonadota bacterium]
MRPSGRMASGRSGPEASQFASIVLFALPREAVPLRKTIEAGRHGSGVSIAVSGIGAANSRLAAERLLRGAGTQPVQLVIAGFAGALTPAIAPGDVMVATR